VPVASEHGDVTVVVPCFNYGRFIPEALASLRAQEGGQPIIVVVDDGSTEPETQAVLASLPDDIRLLRQANAGLAAARNSGCLASSTPLLLALDADDMLPPGALNALKRGLAGDPTAGFAYGTTRFFGDWSGDMTMPGWDPYRLLYRHTIGPTALTRRELFDDIGGWDEQIRGYEDWEFWLHAVANGWHGVKVPEVTFLYRRHGDTMLSGARRQYRRWYRAIRTKHADLYRRAHELARESDLGAFGRAVYRYYWGPRPIPASVEAGLYRILWGEHDGLYRTHRGLQCGARRPRLPGAIRDGAAVSRQWLERVARRMLGSRQANHLVRFLPVLELLQAAPAAGGKLLDVGSGAYGLTTLLPSGWEVTVLDADFRDYGAADGAPADTNSIIGDVRWLPFADHSFDVVVAVDLLEHLPAEDRDRAIAEICRVALRRAVIACPAGAEALAVDRRIARHLDARGRALPGWLHEHLQNGFPEAAAVLDTASRFGPTQAHGNESLRAHERLVLAELNPLPAVLLRLATIPLARMLMSPSTRWRLLARRIVRALGGDDRPPTYRTVVDISILPAAQEHALDQAQGRLQQPGGT
jgi:glycosyltransferase involved in cell wall biosynthesis